MIRISAVLFLLLLSPISMAANIDRTGLNNYHTIGQKSWFWKGANIPYYFDPSVSLTTRNEVAQAIAQWEADTIATFTLITPSSEPAYVIFTEDASLGCRTEVAGRLPGGQYVNLSSYCDEYDAAHEIGHALGLYHEHSRTDRDEWVHHRSHNLTSGADPWNFRRFQTLAMIGIPVGPYDYFSVMHYSAFSHSIAAANGTASTAGETESTLWPLDPSGFDSSNRPLIGYKTNVAGSIRISQGDIDGINVIYNRSFLVNKEHNKCLQSVAGQRSNGDSDHLWESSIATGNVSVNASPCISLSVQQDAALSPESATLIQEWVVSPSGWIISSNGRCLGMSKRVLDKGRGGFVFSQLCTAEDYQRWEYDAGSMTIRTQNGFCLSALDNVNSVATDQYQVGAALCDGSDSQVWESVPVALYN